ncbi:MAG: HDOD domain-containing protein [Candidatus Thiodiazotropha lotti]|nr:HDOD domain-containing protein [Candidatus Thiodiazotropha lotti]MCG8001152.1 HDOD domain-containing protein [Candidatus Thiodiazotropha lotti]MCW4182582.1 HDOD domain-containing protein [Candidatus Thiodiazotropha weberae]MCW4192926.1 HDOD domain-containing protein [Candidatus Thiodiazotropha weberae]
MSETMPDAELHLPPEVVQVGRQPILDKNLNIYGYELLYRSISDSQQGFDGDMATARTVLNSFLEFGLHRLVGKHRVFINMTQRFFTEFTSLPVDPHQIVIEVLEDFELTPAVVDGIRKLHQSGYTIALDDYRFEERWIPLLPYCSLIKVEILGLDLEKYVEPINDLLSRGITLLAEKVETREQFETAKRLGFNLFQGYFFAKPQTLSTTRNPGNRSVLLRTIAQINNPNADIEDVAKLIELDPNLSFKLLRVINSAAQGLTRKITSIREAVVFIGLNRLRAWSTLFVMASLDEASPELITTSLVRAEMCRALADEFNSGHPDSGYTIGLLSTLDAMLNQPMEQLLKEIPLADHMIEALGRHTGPFGNELQCAIDLERCHWMSESTKLLPVEQLNTMYVHALERVEEIRGVFSTEDIQEQ